MKVIFIRHGESAGNADIPSFDLPQIPLTAKGVAQADAVAKAWTQTPSLIVVSPYLRAQMTAAPTLRRFPDVPVKALAIQEFVYLNPAQWGGSTHAQRRPPVEAYWTRADPKFNSGGGAESFQTVLNRVRAALRWLGKLPDDSLVYAFSHGQFMQAVRVLLSHPGLPDKAIMQVFADDHDRHPIANGELMPIRKGASHFWDTL